MNGDKQDFFNAKGPRVPSPAEDEIIAAQLDILDIQPGARVLDVGCGSGVLIPHLSLRTAPQNITGIDICHNALAFAREKFPAVRFIEMDFMLNELPKKSFDYVLCYNAFPHFENPGRAFATMADLAAPGGRIAVMHSIGRDALNRLHAECAPVAEDILSPLEIFRRWAGLRGLSAITAIDAPRMFMFAARRAK
ncbi:MAG: methyltransferase domain-containing protein [Rickettsiales bacterium]|jgi:demethylmenaquinone methyltransferase/2-methoxy-6-polyprenyl-1,4-benzoquinol methylase|nr:methyltransferase domain-containing protein [Rickettsiales bacterium]